jgi:DNA-binding transcriptional ArsR family regulator
MFMKARIVASIMPQVPRLGITIVSRRLHRVAGVCVIDWLLMTLLVHLGVLAIRRLRVTVVAVIITTAIKIVGCILCHALREAGAVCAVLRRGRRTRCSWLVSNRGKLRVRGLLTRHTNSLSHLSIDRRFRRATVMRDTLLLSMLLHLGAMTLVISLASSFFLLLLSFPFFANFFELYNEMSAMHTNEIDGVPS